MIRKACPSAARPRRQAGNLQRINVFALECAINRVVPGNLVEQFAPAGSLFWS